MHSREQEADLEEEPALRLVRDALPADPLRHQGGRGGGGNKKLVAWIGWIEEYLPVCPGCIDLYGKRDPPEDPPCEGCREILAEENADAGMIYHVVKRQVRTAGMTGEIVDLDHVALSAVMDIYGVKDRRDVFEKVTRAFRSRLAERNQGSG